MKKYVVRKYNYTFDLEKELFFSHYISAVLCSLILADLISTSTVTDIKTGKILF